MDEDNKKEEIKEEKNILKVNFFKKAWYAITKIEKYPDLASQGLGKAIGYICKVVAILAIVLCLGTMYQTNQLIGEGINYLQNEFPEFTYSNGILDVQTDQVITIPEDNSVMGETIIDTKTEDEQTINGYINSLEQKGSGLLILKDRVVLKNVSVTGTISYEYDQTFEKMGLEQFNKQDVINYANSTKVINLYASIFLTIFIYSFIMYFLTTISNAVLLSIFGYLTAIIAKIKMRYVAVFNMAIYALTLSVILNMMYITINIFIDFSMEYFQVMYVAVAAIYLVAAIFLLKTEFIKKQAELIKINEAQELIKKQFEQEEKERKEREEKKKEDKEKDKEEKNEDEPKEEKDQNKDKKTRKI